MKKMDELLGSEFKWSQPGGFKLNFELRAGDELGATLRFRSLFGSLATGESADGCWTFKRIGFFQTRVTIRICGDETDIAIFNNKTWRGGGTLELLDGRKLLATTNRWQTNLQFKTEAGEVLLGFKSGGFLHLSAMVEVQQPAIGLPELPWLVMLGCYLIVMMNIDATVAGAVAAT
jgi:hypothetical protein